MIYSSFDDRFDFVQRSLYHHFNLSEGSFNYNEPHKIIRDLNLYFEECGDIEYQNNAIDHISFTITANETELRQIEEQLYNLDVNDFQYYWKKDVHEFARNILRDKINRLIKWINEVSDVEYSEIILSPIYHNTQNRKVDLTTNSQNDVILHLDSKETVKLVFQSLQPYVLETSYEALDDLLNQNAIEDLILFRGNQNILVEFFKRLHYNKKILNPYKTEIRDWLITNFKFLYKKGNYSEFKNLNKGTVYDLLSKGEGEPKKGRICENDTLPYIPHHLIKKSK